MISVLRKPVFVMAFILAQQAMAQPASSAAGEFNNQFQILFHDNLGPQSASSVVDYLAQHFSRVMQELQVSDLPPVTVHLWADYENLYAAQEERYGQSYPGSGGSVWWPADGPPEILAIYDERYEGRRDHTASLLHEFVHILSVAINPTISNNPRWLWESVAIYQAGQVRSGLAGIDYVAEGDYPTIEELTVGFNEANEARNIYQFGYVISEYIVETWGTEGLVSLIRSNGDIPETLGISEPQFNALWHAFMEEHYL